MVKSSVSLILLAIVAFMAGCSSPETVEELRAAGKDAYLDEKFQEAREYFSRALAKSPSDQDLLYFLAAAYQRDSMYDSALFYFQRSNLLFPGDLETNQRIFRIAVLLENWEDAISAINVIAENEDNYDGYAGDLMRLWANDGSPINALYWGKRALANDPGNPQWYLAVAQYAAPCDSIELGLATIDDAINRFDSTYTESLRLQKGVLLAESGQPSEAEKIFREYYATDTTSLVYRHYLANALASQENRAKRQEALEIYRGLQPLVPAELKIDSVIFQLEQQLQ
ncbi:MAG: hypothetical protein GY867_09525 [bacterium]|nr:hypothetical protein [bacterium]